MATPSVVGDSTHPAVPKAFEWIPNLRSSMVSRNAGSNGSSDTNAGSGAVRWFSEAPYTNLSRVVRATPLERLTECARILRPSPLVLQTMNKAQTDLTGNEGVSTADDTAGMLDLRSCYLASLAEHPTDGVYCIKDPTLAKHLAMVDHTLQSLTSPLSLLSKTVRRHIVSNEA